MRPLIRLSLRRYIHSLPPVTPRRRICDNSKLVFGASLAVAGYVSWRIAGTDQRIALDAAPQNLREPDAAVDEPKIDTPPPIKVQQERMDAPTEGRGGDAPEEAEEEGEGAFNPVTGEINWDCPCLGGMAHGPCGQQFREAFSCFVFSEREPKGIDCVEKFKNMQDCFREHPDVYGEEIADDEGDAPELESPADAKPPQRDSTSRQSVGVDPLHDDVISKSNETRPPETL